MDTEAPITSEIYFPRRTMLPIGRIQIAGTLAHTWRTYDLPMRMLDCYAMVYVLEGSGRFRDGSGIDIPIKPGDLLLLFPDVPHAYGPKSGQEWSELYAHFDGPVFDLWRSAGLLDPHKPVFHPQSARPWGAVLKELLSADIEEDPAAQAVQLTQFLSILTQMIALAVPLDNHSRLPDWLQNTVTSLNPSHDYLSVRQLADLVSLPYHVFLRKFKELMGVPPSQYRIQRQILAAKLMLENTDATMTEIASSLQYTDAFHFSNRFKAIVGMCPTSYRALSRNSK